MPVPDLATIAALTTTITEGFKSIAGLVDTMKDAKIKEAVRTAVTDLKEKVMDQRDIILALREGQEQGHEASRAEIEHLRAQIHESVVFDDEKGLHYRTLADGTRQKHPVCTNCYKTKTLVAPMQDEYFGPKHGRAGGHRWVCGTCGKDYRIYGA